MSTAESIYPTEDHSIAGDAVVLIDWENLKYSLKNKQRDVSISALRDAAERRGRLVIARAYGDWREHGSDAQNLYNAGIEPVYVPVRRIFDDGLETRTKNSVDVKLTADCIELIHRFPSITTYILVSGDQDFIHVINTLRPYGKRTILIGVDGTTSVRLAEQVDEMMSYDRDVDPIADLTLVPVAAPVEPEAVPEQILPNVSEEVGRQVLAAIGTLEPAEYDVIGVEKLVRAIIDVVNDYRSGNRVLLASQLGIELGKRAQGPFNRYGRGRLKPILTTLTSHGLTQVVARGGVDWLYLPDEEPPEEESSPYESQAPWWTPSPSILVKERFSELDDSEKTMLIQLVQRLSMSNSFLSFNRIRTALQNSSLNIRVDSTHVINDMIDLEILIHGEDQHWFDPATGASAPYKTHLLATTHPEVKGRLHSVG